MKKIYASFCFMISIGLLAQDEKDSALITPIGKPDGNISAAKFNKEGGRLRSGDGKLELVIPGNALSKKTEISIQPITNQMANGNGKAYRLEPSGTRFNQPVTLIFHYDENENKDSMQLLLGIAMQDDKGRWNQVNDLMLDTVSKTISAHIRHFSDWSNFSSIKINPYYGRVKVTNTTTLEVTGVLPDPVDPGYEGLTPLVKRPKKVIWKVNNIAGGNSIVGTVGGRMQGAYYSAPANVPKQNPVAVTANLQGLNLNFNGVRFTDLRLVSNLLIYDNAYEVTMISSYDGDAGTVLGKVNYKDTGSFVVSLESGEAKIIEKVNKNQSDEWGYKGTCKIELLQSGTGNIHISGIRSIKLIPATSPQARPWVVISFVKAPVRLSRLKITCPPIDRGKETVTTTDKAGAMIAAILPALPLDVKFEAKDGEQTILLIGQEGGEMYVRFQVKQLKD
ncbi:MAG: hypothetical protein ACXWV0_04070 [Flavisolibacter sp.]